MNYDTSAGCLKRFIQQLAKTFKDLHGGGIAGGGLMLAAGAQHCPYSRKLGPCKADSKYVRSLTPSWTLPDVRNFGFGILVEHSKM